MGSLSLPCLCLVTDRHQCHGRTLEDVVARAVDGGVGLVQLREKDLPARQLLELAQRLRALTAGRALLFVNDRVDVALACDADGVQLGEEGLPVETARRVSGMRLLVGRSVHSVEGARKAQADGADVLVVGTIFPTDSHPGAAPSGVGLLERVHRSVRIPFLAIGGIRADNVESVIRAGASGAAVIGSILRSEDPKQASRELATGMRRAYALVGKKGVAKPA